MKQLVWHVGTESINEMTIRKATSLQYIDIDFPENCDIISIFEDNYTNWDDFLYVTKYYEHKFLKWCWVSIYKDLDLMRIFKHEFKNYRQSGFYLKASEHFTIKQLADKLPAKQFLDYVKDNGLNICEMKE